MTGVVSNRAQAARAVAAIRMARGEEAIAEVRMARAERMAAAVAGRPVPAAPVRMADGYERPAVMPADPADVAADRFEREFVRAQRGRNVSWFNIANMTGRTVPYLRALYDDAQPSGEAPR
tara:strand:- start:12803 stop:13165 length:363 start_codon:yes stop_codon:yes gene_type:complete